MARVVLLAVLLGTSAAVQTGGTPVETPPVPLSLEKQAAVKQHVQRAQLPEAQTGLPNAVGMIVPESVELWGLPQNSTTEVPATPSYRFLLTGQTIAVVDPETRKMIQIIPN